MLPSLLSLLAFCCLAVASFGLGRPIVRGLGVGAEDRLSAAVWSIAIGAITAGMLLVGLGLLGALYVSVIGAMTMAALFLGIGEMLRGFLAAGDEALLKLTDGSPEEPDGTMPPWASPARWLSGSVLLLAGAACLASLFSALAPPTAGDALCYHLELPKRFLAEHRLADLPCHDNATFPLLAEMWYLWALAIEGGVCAQLVHWGLGILLALATVLLATPILGRRWGWVAGAVVLLIPGVNNQMTAPMNDIALTAMTTLALAAWWQAAVARRGRRWFVLAGLAAGAALGTKHLALVFAAAWAATWLWAVLRGGGQRRAEQRRAEQRRGEQRRLLLQGAAVVAVVAVSVGGIWYLRAAWYRGNPVFPFFSEVFGSGETAEVPRQETLPASKSPLGRHPAKLAVAPWHLTMHPERFGGRGNQLGVFLLATLPGLGFCRRLRGLGTLLAVAGVYGVLWFLLRQNVRFLYPAVPLLCVAAVWVWIEMRRFPASARRVAAASFTVVLIAMAAVPLVRARKHLAVAVGIEDREHYLVRAEPTYRAAAVANVLLRPGDHILSQDYRAFYFDHRVTRENAYRRRTRYDEDVSDPVELGHRLRRAGFTHLLLAETVAGQGIRYDSTLSRLADAQLSSRAADDLCKLTEYLFQDSDGAVRRYRLVELR